MASLTVIQIIQIFAIYLGVVILLPVLSFGNKLQRFSFPLRMMMYFAIGNFFIINLVLYLQLLHISYRPTLILGTVLFYGYFMTKNRKLDFAGLFFYLLEMMYRRNNRIVGRKTFWRTILDKTKAVRDRIGVWVWQYVCCRIPEWLAGIGLVALIWYLFGQNFLVNLGYGASDIPVHNYWINELSKENLFCAGIYPFGMHAVVYYLHQLFGIDTYVMLRLWGLINICGVCGMLVAFLGWFCQSKTFFPFLGAYLYITPAFIQDELWWRFCSALPQEYGMVFILPAMAFLFEYFLERRQGTTEKDAKLNLFFFALCLALSISIHFYPAIVTLILCLGCGLVFFRTIFTEEYFFLILKTGIFAFALAVLPMMIAYVGGKPLQGSMGWALGVMANGGSGEDNSAKMNTQDMEMKEGYTYVFAPNGNLIAVLEPDQTMDDLTNEQQAQLHSTDDRSVFQKVRDKVVDKGTAIVGLLQSFPGEIKGYVDSFLLKNSYKESMLGYSVLWLLAAGIVIAVLLRIVLPIHGQIFGALIVGYGMLIIMSAAGRLHLPVIMDGLRGRLFLYYMVPVILIGCLNGVVLFLERFHHSPRRSADVAVILSVCILCTTAVNGFVRQPKMSKSMEYPGAITCLTNIVQNSEPYTYTIISANDELRMVEEMGFHYEVISLLKHLALYRKDGYKDTSIQDLSKVDKGHLYIPTEDIFVFIEKIPQDYFGTYAGSGQRVSKEGASRMLPDNKGLSIYYTENRWICMSKLYYWMKAFQQLHPDAVTTYYQDKEFVCYRIHQNVFSLYDLCIDYGYNHCGETKITVND